MMRRLSQSIVVKASSSFALAYVKTYFLERGAQGSATLALRFPLPDVVIRGLTVEKVVSLRIAYGAADADGKSVVISWKPAGTLALPDFSGQLTALAQTDETCRLTIEGGYVPPGRIAGAIFDSLVGVRIARATLIALLSELTTQIEGDYSARFR